jgi:hypothetical protein
VIRSSGSVFFKFLTHISAFKLTNVRLPQVPAPIGLSVLYVCGDCSEGRSQSQATTVTSSFPKKFIVAQFLNRF